MGTGIIIQPKFDPVQNSGTEEKLIDDFCVEWINWNTGYQTHDFTLTRIGESADLMFAPLTREFKGMSDFDKYMPWKGIRLCNLSMAGDVTGYYGTPEFSFEPENGNVMVEIPKFWYKIDMAKEANTEGNYPMQFHISPTEKEGWFLSPRHMKFGDRTKDLDKIYVSAYPAQLNLRSISGGQPIQNMLSTEVADYIIENNMANYYQIDWFTLFTIEILRLVETCHFNVNYLATFDTNVLNVNTYAGLTDSMKFHSGQTIKNTSWRYRYLENLADANTFGASSRCQMTYCALANVRSFYESGRCKLRMTLDPHGFYNENPEYILDLTNPDLRSDALSLFRIDPKFLSQDSSTVDWQLFMPTSTGSSATNYSELPLVNGYMSITGQYYNYNAGCGNMYFGDSMLLSLGACGSAGVNSSSTENDKTNERRSFPNLHTRFIYLPPEK